MFNGFFSDGFVPPVWKEAYVKPIHKSGNAWSVQNYRPISLTCVCAKVMESIVSEQLMAYLLDNGLITKSQHGLLAKRSTCTNLLDTFQDWVIALNGHANIDVVFIDFAKAFESVSHVKLLHKLRGYGVQYELLGWIKSFLENRSQRVMVDGTLSGAVPVRSGVVQGSVLGPLLFVCFINDVTSTLDGYASYQLYADDLKLYSQVELNVPNKVASSLDKLKSWSEIWQLGINGSKCSVMHLGSSNQMFQYNIGPLELPNITQIRDLGITYNNKLCFGDYIDTVVARAYQRIYLIFRGFASRCQTLLKRAYITYVRPLLEYCTPVWSPYLISDISRVENVQRYFTRRLFPMANRPAYQDRLKLLDIESLEMRRLKCDLKMYYQIMHGLVNLDRYKFFHTVNKSHKTRSHDLQIEKPLYRNNNLANTFASRVIDCWNNLDEQIVTASSLKKFKSSLDGVNLNQYCLSSNG